MLGTGFGLLQVLTRADSAGPPATPSAAATADTQTSASGPVILNAASLGPSVQIAAPAPLGATPADVQRPIRASSKVLEPNYTIAAGDTLVKIAARFNTTVERIQAFNSNGLADPRALRIGTKLVIPPPL